MKILIATLLGVALAACQSTTMPAGQNTSVTAQTATSAGAYTTEDARTAVRHYLRAQPDSALYVLNSAAILDADASWQVLVPRTDWANRRPNRAAFDVDKATGTVTRRLMK